MKTFKNRGLCWLAAAVLLAVMSMGVAAGLPAAEPLLQAGGDLELVSKIQAPAPASVSRGGDFEMRAGVQQITGLSSYGGDYMLTATGGVDTTLTAGCECVCGGSALVFVNGFETGDTSAWSAVVQ